MVKLVTYFFLEKNHQKRNSLTNTLDNSRKWDFARLFNYNYTDSILNDEHAVILIILINT